MFPKLNLIRGGDSKATSVLFSRRDDTEDWKLLRQSCSTSPELRRKSLPLAEFYAEVFIIFLLASPGFILREVTERGGVKTFRLITAASLNIKYIPAIFH